jgi:hypothetical protein
MMTPEAGAGWANLAMVTGWHRVWSNGPEIPGWPVQSFGCQQKFDCRNVLIFQFGHRGFQPAR